MPTPEGQIKKEICEWLEAHRIFFWVTQSVGIAGRKNNSRFAGKGVSDINAVINGRFVAIEIKAPGGKVSDDQTEFQEKTRKAGGIAFVARSLTDVRDWMRGKS